MSECSTKSMDNPVDVDALEQRKDELYDEPIVLRGFIDELLAALRQQQALHKREQETTTVMINGLTHEIARLRAEVSTLTISRDDWKALADGFSHEAKRWKRKALENESG